MHAEHPCHEIPQRHEPTFYTLRHGVVDLTSLFILLINITQVQLPGLVVKVQDLTTRGPLQSPFCRRPTQDRCFQLVDAENNSLQLGVDKKNPDVGS